MGFAQQAMATG